MADRVMMLEIHYASGKTFYGVGQAAEEELDRLISRAPEPEGTRTCGNCGLELAETETEEQCRAIFGNLTAEQKAECVGESPSSASEQENKNGH